MRNVFLFPATLATVVATLPGAALATSTTCSTSAVCAEYVNTYTSSSPVSGGVAIHGESNGGIGIRGTSVSNVGFYGASGAGNYYVPGVEGESTNNNGNDAAGGFGLASLVPGKQAPYLGVLAFGTFAGVQGETDAVGTSSSSAGYGIYGGDGRGISNASKGDYNAGVLGFSYLGTAVLAAAGSAPKGTDFSREPIGIYAVADHAEEAPEQGAIAMYGESDTIGLYLSNTTSKTVLLGANSDYFLYGLSDNGGTFYIDNNGNEVLPGTLTTSKGEYVRTTGSSGTAVREYTDRTTVPQVEDVGDGQLVNGRAYVAIDGRLADTIDRRMEYHVFVTPEGDCNGLFVTQKTPSGFVVRELRGGRSSLAFEYRIVAKPIDENGTRLESMPAATLPKDLALERGARRQNIAPPLSIEDNLKRRLGPQGYAKAIAALSARLAGR